MNILENVFQGTEKWTSIRTKHFTASEAPVAFGVSKYLDRNELLQQKATGKIPEISGAQQKLFDAGHESESKARLLAEEIVGSDLYPVTATLIIDDLPLLASFDGVNLTQDIIWEHKLWSESLYKQVTECNLDPHYSIQLDHQLLISGAEKCLFMTSDGTKDNCAWMWYETTEQKKSTLISTWNQFKKDLAEYQPREITEKPVVVVTHHLPSVNIQVKGELTVCNLADVTPHFDKFIEQAKVYLETDEDFAIAESESKIARDQAKRCNDTARSVIDQMLSVSEIVSKLEEYAGKFNALALKQEKLVKSQKDKIKEEIIDDACMLCEHHVDAIHDELIKFVNFGNHAHPAIWSRRNFEAACKNKRTLASLHNAVDTEVAAIKIKLDDLARVIRKNLTHLPEDLSLFRDLQSIITKPEDDFKLLVESRLAEQKRKEEEAAKRAAEEVKAAEERGRAQAAKAIEEESNIKPVAHISLKNNPEPELRTSGYAQVIPDSFQPSKKTMDSIGEIIQSFADNGIDKSIAVEVIDLILKGKIKHISINF